MTQPTFSKPLVEAIIQFLVDVSDIFNFFCSGEGKGESGATGREGGRFFFLKIPGGGGVIQEGVGVGEGTGRVSAGNLGELGGGAKYFFSGPKCPPRIVARLKEDPRDCRDSQQCV